MDAGSGVETFGPEALTKRRGEVGSREHGTSTGGEVGKGALNDAIELWSARGSKFKGDGPGRAGEKFLELQVLGGIVAANVMNEVAKFCLEFLEFVKNNCGKLSLCLMENTKLHARIVIDDEGPVTGTSDRFVANVTGVDV